MQRERDTPRVRDSGFSNIGQIKIIFVSLTLFQIQLRSVEDDRDAIKDNARLSM